MPLFRADLGFLRTAQIVDLQELVPGKEDPILSIAEDFP